MTHELDHLAKESNQVMSYLRRHQFMILLISLVLLMVSHPLTEGIPQAEILLYLVFNLLMLASLLVIGQSKIGFILGLTLGIPALVGSWSQFALGTDYSLDVSSIDILAQVAMVVFLLLVTSMLIKRVFSGKEVTADHLYGSASAYLLLGFVWAYMYIVIEMVSPGSFIVDPMLAESELIETRLDQSSLLFYYSFVSLSTLGFGDITPRTSIARTLTMYEAICGQIFLTVLVARLVGLHISRTASK